MFSPARAARSLHLDGPVDRAHEPEAREEAHRSRKDEEGVRGDEHVRHVHHDREGAHHDHLRAQVHDGVREEVQSGRARSEEAAPPPVVVLRAELEVAHDDGDLRAGDEQDEEDHKQKAEDVVELVQPDRGEDEEELDEHRAKGQHTAHDDREGRLHVPHLLGHLPRDLIRAHGEVGHLPLVPEVGAEEDERRRDTEPEEQQGHERAERHRA
mmetsp:Transcript_14655/g.38056  ORF Transcript_14655/g.38056 Transcript_14655/m.38056 type:complete len:212 (+) Transcript_14655:244-879(+)